MFDCLYVTSFFNRHEIFAAFTYAHTPFHLTGDFGFVVDVDVDVDKSRSTRLISSLHCICLHFFSLSVYCYCHALHSQFRLNWKCFLPLRLLFLLPLKLVDVMIFGHVNMSTAPIQFSFIHSIFNWNSSKSEVSKCVVVYMIESCSQYVCMLFFFIVLGHCCSAFAYYFLLLFFLLIIFFTVLFVFFHIYIYTFVGYVILCVNLKFELETNKFTLLT